jgi:DNA-binding NtrC family response regulator
MGQAQSPQRRFRPTALVVEDEPLQRFLACTLLEEAEFTVVECLSAEAALSVLEEKSAEVVFVFADVKLAGTMDGVELATIINECHPQTSVAITSGDIGDRASKIPTGVQFMPKPWQPLDLLMTAERARMS